MLKRCQENRPYDTCVGIVKVKMPVPLSLLVVICLALFAVSDLMIETLFPENTVIFRSNVK